jgi:hypothetical protein
MEKDELLKDDFLRELVQKSPLESPSDDFVEKIMSQIELQPEPATVKKPFYLWLKSWSGYIALTLFVIFIFLTSDLSFLNFIPGKKYFSDLILPYINSILLPLKALFNNGKSLTIPLMIMVSSGLLFLFDRLLTRKSVVQ